MNKAEQFIYKWQERDSSAHHAEFAADLNSLMQLPGRESFRLKISEIESQTGYTDAYKVGKMQGFGECYNWLSQHREQPEAEQPDKPTEHYRCLLCGRDKFTRKSPHNCRNGFQKHHLKWGETIEAKLTKSTDDVVTYTPPQGCHNCRYHYIDHLACACAIYTGEKCKWEAKPQQPDNDGWVKVEDVTFAGMIVDHLITDGYDIGIGWCDGKHWYTNPERMNVTHCMLLPSPPKKL